MSEFGMISTGDAAKDAHEMERFIERDRLIRAGMCPNGCGGMVEVDEHNAECVTCGFGYYSSGGLKFEVANRA